MIAGKIDKTHTILGDLLERNFNSDWLPSYDELRAELIAQYTKFKLWNTDGPAHDGQLESTGTVQQRGSMLGLWVSRT